ncbi:MAG: hypothetical protein A2Z04_02430 [Chloroflexi bacterium RBG_16_57_9]|nr:MAG: hypothetical protein A2Z04_02430 [Chloroflexi bacterium RBG_16_57_9]
MHDRYEKQVIGELERIRSEVDRIFERLTPTGHHLHVQSLKAFRPPTDVYETEDHVEIRVEVAGMQPEDFQISLNEQHLIVSGSRRDLTPKAKRAYQQMEICWGEFRTDVHLTWSINDDGIEASYRDGFLLITLPKARATDQQIPINVVVKR